MSREAGPGRWAKLARALLIALSLVPHTILGVTGLREGGPSTFLLQLVSINLIPVLLGVAASFTPLWPHALGWLAATFLGSVYAVCVAIIWPTSSTSSLLFLFLPAWNTLLLGPVGAFVAHVWWRRITRVKQAPSVAP